MAIPLLVIAVNEPRRCGTTDRSTGSPSLGQVVVYGLGAIGLGLRDQPRRPPPVVRDPGVLRARQRRVAARRCGTSSSGRRIDRWQPARRRGPPRPTPSRHRTRRRMTARATRTVDRRVDRAPAARRDAGGDRRGRAHRHRRARGRASSPPTRRSSRSRRQRAVPRRSAIILRPDVATLTTIAILYSNAAVVARPLPRRPGVRRGLRAAPAGRAARARPRRPPAAGRRPTDAAAGWSCCSCIHLVSALFSTRHVALVGCRGRLPRRGVRPVLPAHQRHPDARDAPRRSTWVLLGGRSASSAVAVGPPGRHGQLRQRTTSGSPRPTRRSGPASRR